MTWWWRLILTLVLGPILWWGLAGYVAIQQGMSFAQWLADVPKPSAYLVLTLPAAILCLVLIGLERLLKLSSLDIFTVILAPLVGYALCRGVVQAVPMFHNAAGLTPVFAAYGLVWGLTIREPRRRGTGDRRGTEDRSDGAFVDALLPSERRSAEGPGRAVAVPPR